MICFLLIGAGRCTTYKITIYIWGCAYGRACRLNHYEAINLLEQEKTSESAQNREMIPPAIEPNVCLP